MLVVSRALSLCSALISPLAATSPSHGSPVATITHRTEPSIRYRLTVSREDLTTFAVEMRIRNAPDTLRLAMARHPEYDNRFWRFIRDLSVRTPTGEVAIVRQDSALWRAVIAGGEAIVRYRIQLPEAPRYRRSWQPFLRETGGLTGGPQSFMYLVGYTLIPSHLTIEMPADWKLATGLEPTSDPQVFYAPNFEALIDSPILMGVFRTWRFEIDGVPHRVVYWPLPDATPFDTTAFVGSVERIAREAVAIFGRAPYRDYVYLYQDGSGDALEHGSSVTLGAQSSDLARDPYAAIEFTAHEYFHTWNLVRLRPAGWGAITWQPPTRTTALWWSEGVTIYFAEAILRRAGLMDEASARRHLTDEIQFYLSNPGNTRITPEQASWTTNDPPEDRGPYSASFYTQGTLIGEVLEIVIRDSTDTRRGLDDVIRAMYDHYGETGTRGFTGADLERTASEVCGCNLHSFFEAHVRGARRLELERYLKDVGFQVVVTRTKAVDSAGQPSPDLRARAYLPEGAAHLRLYISAPTSAWGRSGLRSGDELLAINTMPIPTDSAFKASLATVRIGDRLLVEYSRKGRPSRAEVLVKGFQAVRVALEDLPSLSDRQRVMRRLWMSGK